MILAPRDNQIRLTVLPEAGGLCHQLEFSLPGGHCLPVLAACSEAELAQGNPWYRGAWLYPFPSRLSGGRYSWQGETYQFALNEPDLGNALHGFLNRLAFRVAEQEVQDASARVSLVCDYVGADPGYPFPATISIDYRLESPGSLMAVMTVTNRHSTPVPLGVGWHPYLKLPGKLHDWVLQLPAGDLVVLEDRLLPTGETTVFTDFQLPARLGDLTIDAPLRLALEGRAEARLWSPQCHAGVVLWQDTGQGGALGFNYLQLFIPPDRQSLALEPVSCGINAFNSEENLTVLAAAESITFTCGISLLTGTPGEMPA